MTLTKEQKKELTRLSEKLRKIEKLSAENNIDLDVFMTDYNLSGTSVYLTEKVTMAEKASERKNIFEKEAKEKPRNISRSS